MVQAKTIGILDKAVRAYRELRERVEALEARAAMLEAQSSLGVKH